MQEIRKQFQRVAGEFPVPKRTGNFRGEQGIFSKEQGIHSSEQGIPFR
jgi:hypothetical protein